MVAEVKDKVYEYKGLDNKEGEMKFINLQRLEKEGGVSFRFYRFIMDEDGLVVVRDDDIRYRKYNCIL